MKNILAAAAAAALVLSMAGCGSAKAELALVTDGGSIDDQAFNQAVWSGLIQYAEENEITSKAYEPGESSTDAYLASIDLAVKNGAAAVICAGPSFADAVESAQQTYPDVDFIAVDCELPEPASNALGITYAEEQIGFLAGYAAVREGYRSLGYLGGPLSDSAQKYGFGFIQGADAAARELELDAGSVTVRYLYTGSDTDVQETASSWFTDGVECMFTAQGEENEAVMQAAENSGGAVIAAGVDQSGRSGTVIASAVKGFAPSVYETLADIYAGEFEGGQTVVFDAASNGVSLTMDTAKFKHFTQADYDAVFTKLQTDADGIVTSIAANVSETGSVEESGLVTTIVSVEQLN